MEAQAGAQRFLDLLDAPDEEADAPDARTPATRPHRVALREVSFSYDGEPLLRGVDFSLEPGETVALVGRSGSGKSTIAELLLRLHEPDSGRVEIDGHNRLSRLR